MKARLLVFLLVASLLTWAQGRSGGHQVAGNVGPPNGVAEGNSGVGPHSTPNAGQPTDTGSRTRAQQPLKDSQITSGAFRMLREKTGMTSSELQTLYASSGARNFGEFVSAIVVAKNLNLDMNAVLDGLKTQSLGQTLQTMGVSPADSKRAMEQAKRETKQANKGA